MNILILKGSGNRRGSSALLADEFARSARAVGHEVSEYDVVHADIRNCTGCNVCGMAGACVEGGGCGTPEMTRSTRFPQAAYDLGKSLKSL